MNNLQDIVNKKAKDRAENEVRKFIEKFRENSNILVVLDKLYINENQKSNEDDEIDTLRSCFWNTDNVLPKYIIEELIKQYIPEESRKFIDKVEELSNEIEELKNS